ncbi:hypothetical protein PtB15_8B680 [Puccinia triticina]|nr:hypothetical protein PtB15_8B680 [Puccinia triticina]
MAGRAGSSRLSAERSAKPTLGISSQYPTSPPTPVSLQPTFSLPSQSARSPELSSRTSSRIADQRTLPLAQAGLPAPSRETLNRSDPLCEPELSRQERWLSTPCVLRTSANKYIDLQLSWAYIHTRQPVTPLQE